MEYFDGCYFDGSYFDASECVAPPPSEGGHILRRTRRPIRMMAANPLLEDDEEALFALEVLT